ncbi:nucleotidyl transferase AbiEii/AbiGii toxin family protein [Granulicella sp. S156]|uniref:nucleotidyl transferase AbiEii/AbiGii toxin family protein n=1 Tax=Granulicella sp. S156 TaxID=1747224 RepID=UPI00352AE5DF
MLTYKPHRALTTASKEKSDLYIDCLASCPVTALGPIRRPAAARSSASASPPFGLRFPCRTLRKCRASALGSRVLTLGSARCDPSKIGKFNKRRTSLSKGRNLIQRFSEDIDIFLDLLAFEPPLTKRGIDRELKNLRDAVAAHPALQFVPEESQTI